MQKGLFFLISFLFISICNCQVAVHFLDRKTLIKNHVRKAIQVNKTNQTSSHADSSYAVFNEKGQVIISNDYDYQYNQALGVYEPEEEIVYRYYDENGKLVGQVNYIPKAENPIKNIFLHSEDTISKITSHMGFRSYTEGECTLDLFTSTKPIDTSQFNQDTIWITKYHAKVPAFHWRETTYYEEIKFDPKGRVETLERVEFAFKPGTYEHKVKTSYCYDKNGNLISSIENRFDEKGKHYETDEFFYSDNGLLTTVRLQDKRNHTVREYEFTYEYRN
ncbi:MAG: hypothetical protein K0S23_2256 [Fluviicola sp.]|jgi:hypothetical protein|uniref:hypothetical protein n=1 Tax=Fluviicola sp. TaxID=1917219 RepID=UPI00261EBBEB|nr:hypothetical protein [Fluviicola sp.]MDF3027949.1 hypothetical protein [Fluviicola sp.]